jgi:hypothetical protein
MRNTCRQSRPESRTTNSATYLGATLAEAQKFLTLRPQHCVIPYALRCTCGQGEGSPLRHGIQRILHQIEHHAAERAAMKYRVSQVREPFQLQPPAGGDEVLPLLCPRLHGNPQILRGLLAGGHTRQGDNPARDH